MTTVGDNIYSKDAQGNWVYKWSTATQKRTYQIDPETGKVTQSVSWTGQIPFINASPAVWSGMKWAGLKNNNPWNIKDTSFGSPVWTGANWFAQFASPEDGFDALVEKIKFNQTNPKSSYYGKTLQQYFQRYAPSTDGNNPDAYAKEVANKLWVSINTKISDVDTKKFAAAIAKHDSWYDYSTYGQFRWQTQSTNWTQWLDTNTIKRVNAVIDDASTDQVSKTFKKSQEAYIFAKSVADGKWATDNQALIYAFAKAMDPDSVVREGEYATVQKYSQTRWDLLGMNVNRAMNGQEFISEQAKKNIVNTIKTRYEASKQAYESVRNNKVKIINDIAWKPIGETIIPSDVIEQTIQPDIKETFTAKFSTVPTTNTSNTFLKSLFNSTY